MKVLIWIVGIAAGLIAGYYTVGYLALASIFGIG